MEIELSSAIRKLPWKQERRAEYKSKMAEIRSLPCQAKMFENVTENAKKQTSESTQTG